MFSKYFKNIPSKDPPTLPKYTNNNLNDVDFDIITVANALKNSPAKNSTSSEGISYKILKHCYQSLSPIITELFRTSLHNGKAPRQWKESIVMPIFKKGLKSNPTNYRPISLTSTICRIFEKIISQQILNFLITNNLINPNQFGFLKGRSTITQLISTLQTWYETILKGDSTDCIYIYFRKAFDSVPIKFLIYKLEKLGISGKLLSWFADFLTNRTFRVKIGESFSSSYEIKSGVPQGSVLGPLLFLYYINDLPGVLPQHLHIKLYADDAKIYEHFDKNNSKLLQEGLDSIIKWSQDWALPIAHVKPLFFILVNTTLV